MAGGCNLLSSKGCFRTRRKLLARTSSDIVIILYLSDDLDHPMRSSLLKDDDSRHVRYETYSNAVRRGYQL